jgi:hypothetical protein
MEMPITKDVALTQATVIAKHYLLHAVTDIDEMFGKGYAKEHPELIAAYMRASALSFHTAARVHGGGWGSSGG